MDLRDRAELKGFLEGQNELLNNIQAKKSNKKKIKFYSFILVLILIVLGVVFWKYKDRFLLLNNTFQKNYPSNLAVGYSTAPCSYKDPLITGTLGKIINGPILPSATPITELASLIAQKRFDPYLSASGDCRILSYNLNSYQTTLQQDGLTYVASGSITVQLPSGFSQSDTNNSWLNGASSVKGNSITKNEVFTFAKVDSGYQLINIDSDSASKIGDFRPITMAQLENFTFPTGAGPNVTLKNGLGNFTFSGQGYGSFNGNLSLDDKNTLLNLRLQNDHATDALAVIWESDGGTGDWAAIVAIGIDFKTGKPTILAKQGILSDRSNIYSITVDPNQNGLFTIKGSNFDIDNPVNPTPDPLMTKKFQLVKNQSGDYVFNKVSEPSPTPINGNIFKSSDMHLSLVIPPFLSSKSTASDQNINSFNPNLNKLDCALFSTDSNLSNQLSSTCFFNNLFAINGQSLFIVASSPQDVGTEINGLSDQTAAQALTIANLNGQFYHYESNSCPNAGTSVPCIEDTFTVNNNSFYYKFIYTQAGTAVINGDNTSQNIFNTFKGILDSLSFSNN
jgi:hypothetical protein